MMCGSTFVLLCACIILSYFSLTDSARILGIYPIQSKTHFSLNRAIIKSLLSKGHTVTVLSGFPEKYPVHNQSDVDISNYIPSSIDSREVEWNNATDIWDIMKYKMQVEPSTCKNILSSDYIKNIVESKTKLFDIIIVEVYSIFCYIPMAIKLDIPIINIIAPSLGFGVDYITANPNNPAYIPIMSSGLAKNMNFWQRLRNTYEYLVYYYHQNAIFDKLSVEIFHDIYGGTQVSRMDLYNKLSLTFNYGHPLVFPRANLPNIIELGGLHIQEEKPLPKENFVAKSEVFSDKWVLRDDLLKEIKEIYTVDNNFKIAITNNDIRQFINNARDGVIFFSFGSTVKASSLPQEKRRMFAEVFSKIPQRVLWRTDDLNLTEVSENVKFGYWFPQRDILEHKNVRIFISHGGLFGTYEAIHTGTPVIGIPFAYDQKTNIKILEGHGGAIHLEYNQLTTEILLTSLKEILSNESYEKTMRKLSTIFRDRPVSPLETAMYWIEYVIRHNGAPHLKSPAMNMPLYQYLLLDVIAFVVLIAIIVIYSVVFVLQNVIKLLQSKNTAIKYKKEKKLE